MCKVSSFFQVVVAASDAADLLDCAGLNPCQRREYFRNERHYILHASGHSTDDHDPEREDRNILLILQVSIDRHEGIDQAACSFQQGTVLRSIPPETLYGRNGPTSAAIRSCGRFSSSSTRTSQ